MEKEQQKEPLSEKDIESIIQRSLWQRLTDWLFGYDFFLSYRWSDGREYALSLAKNLNEANCDCFLDSEEYKPGANWVLAGALAIRKTTHLVLITTPDAVDDPAERKGSEDPIIREVQTFRQSDRHVIKLDLGLVEDDKWSQSQLSGYFRGSDLYLNEKPANRHQPSEHILGELNRLLRINRRENRRVRILKAGISILLTLLIAVIVAAVFAAAKQHEAQHRLALNEFESGINQIESGDPFIGLATLGKAFEIAQPGDPLRTSIRDVAGRWSGSLGNIFPGNVDAWVFSSDGNSLLAVAQGYFLKWDLLSGELLSEWKIPGEIRITNHAQILIADTGDLLITPHERGGLNIWDPTTQKFLYAFEHDSAFGVAALNPEGDMLVTGSREGLVKLWNPRTAVLVEKFTHDSAIDDLVFSSDGRSLIVGCNDGSIRIWEIKNSKQIRKDVYRDDGSCPLLLRPDGRQIATMKDESIYLWPMRDSAEEIIIDMPDVKGMAYSPDGRLLAVGDLYGQIAFWRTDTGLQDGRMLAQPGRVEAIRFSHDGMTLITGGEDSIRYWSVTERSEVGGAVRRTGWIQTMEISSDGRYLLARDSDGRIQTWDVTMNRSHEELEEVVVSATSNAGELVAMAGYGGVQLFSGSSGDAMGNPIKHGSEVLAVALSFDGEILLSGGVDGQARLWRTNDRTPIGPGLSHSFIIRSAAFNPQGTRVVCGCLDGTAKIWQVNSQQQIGKTIKLGERKGIWAVAMSPDGKLVVTGSEEGDVCLWNSLNAQLIANLEGHVDTVVRVAFSPSGRILATGSLDNTVRLWNVESCELLFAPLHHNDIIKDLIITDDETIIVTAGSDAIRIWNLKNGVSLTRPIRPGAEDITINEEGTMLLTGGGNGAQVWDLRTGSPMLAPLIHSTPVSVVSFSKNGDKIITGGPGGVRVWPFHNDVSTSSADFILRLRAKTGLRADAKGVLRPITFDDWVKMRRKN
ncbi:MAG: WD40 repeat protein [Verrucomicrobiales bacterium]|jgi:WD40 repeat protein